MDVTPDIYTANDFKIATAALLPPGEYWQYEKNGDLDNLLSVLGQEFKTTHDETTSNVLYERDNNQAGWKISDYQALLASFSINGTVFDKSSTPNLIYIKCEHSSQMGRGMQKLEGYRLPHTAFFWEVVQNKKLYCAVHNNSLSVNRSKSILTSNKESKAGLVSCAVTHHSLVINRTQLRAIQWH